MEFDTAYAPLPVEIRRDGDGQPTQLVGYAAVFYNPEDRGTEYPMKFDGRTVVERFERGAFDALLAQNPDVVAAVDHRMDSDQILGRTSAGTLRLWADQKGLGYSVDLAKRQSVADMLEQVQRGDIPGSSLGFLPAEGGAEVRKDGETWVRSITEVGRLRDVGPTCFPAFRSTSVSVRSDIEAVEASIARSTVAAARQAAVIQAVRETQANPY